MQLCINWSLGMAVNITFLGSPNNEEEEGVLSILVMLANTTVAPQGDDEILWPHDPSGQFTIKSHCREIYKGLDQHVFPT